MIVAAKYLRPGDKQVVRARGRERAQVIEGVEWDSDEGHLVIVTYVDTAAVRCYYAADEVEVERELEELSA